MIFNFRLVSDEVDNFKREIEIDADDTFLDLRNAICDAVQYDRSEMCSFFLCDDSWEKEKEITLEDMGTDSDEDTYLMDECILSDYLDDEGQKLMFVFDYMTDRAFFLQLKKIITGKSLKDPVCTLSMGKAPDQHIDMKRFEAKSMLKQQSRHPSKISARTSTKTATTKTNSTRKVSQTSPLTNIDNTQRLSLAKSDSSTLPDFYFF